MNSRGAKECRHVQFNNIKRMTVFETSLFEVFWYAYLISRIKMYLWWVVSINRGDPVNLLQWPPPSPPKKILLGPWTGHCISESFIRSKTLSYTSNICMHSPDLKLPYTFHTTTFCSMKKVQCKVQSTWTGGSDANENSGSKLALEISSRFIRAPGLQTETWTDV